MIVYYKKKTYLTDYVETKIDKVTMFKKPGWLESFGLRKTVYPDIYFHTGSLTNLSKILIEKSKIVIVNSPLLRDQIAQDLKVESDKLKVIYPAVDIPKFKKKEVKKPFYEEHNISQENKIIYFTAKNFPKSGFDNFCDIVSKIEETNFQIVITCKEKTQLEYAKNILESYDLSSKVIIIDYEIFDIADIFLLPTMLKNISINVIKAMASKCVVLIPDSTYAVEFVDIFSIINLQNSQNTAYKIDMILKINDELKKIQKANYSLGKKLNFDYQKKKMDQILEEFEKNIAK